jgi:hypothetical protein
LLCKSGYFPLRSLFHTNFISQQDTTARAGLGRASDLFGINNQLGSRCSTSGIINLLDTQSYAVCCSWFQRSGFSFARLAAWCSGYYFSAPSPAILLSRNFISLQFVYNCGLTRRLDAFSKWMHRLGERNIGLRIDEQLLGLEGGTYEGRSRSRTRV